MKIKETQFYFFIPYLHNQF